MRSAKNMLSRIAVVLLLALAPLCLVACGADPNNDALSVSEGQGSTSANQDDMADNEDSADEFAEKLVGTWRLSAGQTSEGERGNVSSLDELNVVVVNEFKESGTGRANVYQDGEDVTTSNSVFTWEVAEDGASVTMKLNGKTSIVELDGDRLVITAEDKSQTQWERVDAQALERELESAREASGREVAPGEKVTTSKYEFVIDSGAFTKAIYPPDTTGYYSYYEAESDQVFYVAEGTFKNLDTSYVDIKWGTDAKIVINDTYEYTAQVEGARSGDSDFYGQQPDPLETVDVAIFATIPGEVTDSITSARLEWSFTDDLQNFYNENNKTVTYVIDLI